MKSAVWRSLYFPGDYTFESKLILRLFDHRGKIGRLEFLLAELARGVGLFICCGLYHHGWIVPAEILLPVAVWPGVVATIKRLRDLGHGLGLVLPILMYLSAGFAADISMTVQLWARSR